jgi:hypothetical protein
MKPFNMSSINTLLTPWSRVLEKVTACSASQETPCLLQNPTVHCHVQKSPPLVSILSQNTPVHTFKQNFPKIQFKIIFPLRPRSSESSLHFRLSNQKKKKKNFACISHLPNAPYIPCPPHPP